MYPQRRTRGQALRLGMLVTLLVLALSACGGNERFSKPQPLPEEEQQLRTGVYRSEEFKPSLTFRVGEGWSSSPLEASDVLQITRGQTAGLAFGNVQEVYKPPWTGGPNVVDAPEDMVGWFQEHPYLRTSKPEPVTVGGVKGVQLDVVVENLPEDHFGVCGSECVDLFANFSTVSAIPVFQVAADNKVRLIVLEGVKGDNRVVISLELAPLGAQRACVEGEHGILDHRGSCLNFPMKELIRARHPTIHHRTNLGTVLRSTARAEYQSSTWLS